MRAVRRVGVAACLASILAAWVGCAGSHQADATGGASGSSGSFAGGGSAGSTVGGSLGGLAQCPSPPRDDELAPVRDTCAACPGMECTGDGITCESSWHGSGSPWVDTCQCVAGHMVCCSSSKVGLGTASCNYGSVPPPDCPAAMPPSGDACGEKPMYCPYPSSCCTQNAVAACRDGTWQLECAYYSDLPTTPECSAGAAGAAVAAGAAGAAGAAD